MKHTSYMLSALLLLGASGCLFPEKIETRIKFKEKAKFTGEAAQPEVTIIYHNISSDAKEDDDFQKDFEELLKANQKIGAEEETQDGIIVKERSVSIAAGKIYSRTVGVPENNRLEGVVANGERILVVEGEENEGIVIEATNGKVLNTGKNFILVWPSDLQEIYWVQRLTPDDEEDKAALARNQPRLVRMWEEHLQQK